MEFEFTKGSLKAAGLAEGDIVECTYSDSSHISEGKAYYVYDGLYTGADPVIVDDEGDELSYYHLLVKFKPVPKSGPQGELLQDILHHCKEGDVLVCSMGDILHTQGKEYHVVAHPIDGKLVIRCDNGNFRACSISRFIKVDNTTEDEHDTWGIGKQYKAPKKEWQPDVMDVDLTKKIWEW